MELRRCSNLHYINAISGGLVTKVKNVNSQGRPGLKFKKLEDIFEAIHSKNLDAASTLESQDGYRVVDHNAGSPRLAMAERKTSDRVRETDTLSHTSKVEGSGTDLEDSSFGEITLKQLKKSCKTKKRKFSDLGSLTPKQELMDSLPEEDENDLWTPLSLWKSKLSKKAKSKKKCTNRVVCSTSKPNLSVKSEQIQAVSQNSSSGISAPVNVKLEVVDECLESQIMSSGTAGSTISTSFSDSDLSEVPQSVDTVLESNGAPSIAKQGETCLEATNFNSPKRTGQNSSVSPASESPDQAIRHSPSTQSFLQLILSADKVMSENKKTLSLAGQAERCLINESFHSHLEDVDTNPLLPPLGGEIMELNSPKKGNENSSVSHASGFLSEAYNKQSSAQSLQQKVFPTEDQSSDMSNISRSSPNLHEISGSDSGYQVSDMGIDDCLSFPKTGPGSRLCMSGGDIKKFPGICDISRSCSNPQELCNSDPGYQVCDAAIADGSFCAKNGQGTGLSITQDDINNCSDVCDSSQSSSDLQEFSASDSSCEVSNVAVDGSLYCTKFDNERRLSLSDDDLRENLSQNVQSGDMSNSFSNCRSSRDSSSCSSPVNNSFYLDNGSPVIEDKQLLVSNTADADVEILKPNNHLTTIDQDGSFRKEEKQLPKSDTGDAERSLPRGDGVDVSASETDKNHDVLLWQPPERLPSARKVISPTSQERLCLAMNSVDLFDNTNHYKCKGKLFFEKQVESKVLPAGSDSEGVESSVKVEEPEQVNQTKVIIGPKKILMKPKHKKTSSPPKKGSPPKGSPEGPHLSRKLPQLSTGCTSIEVFSESAIAFSQRQMHDIESLATKLVTELKSMRDMVEEKLLYEAYRSTSLKNDADEVKTAIKSARKVEETAKRWLSMMTRDSNRFCKIMKLAEDGSATKENIFQKEKKISFADEAGGMLCHVNVFEKGMASSETCPENQTLQAKEC